MKTKYLNVKQVCKVLGVSRSTFYRKHRYWVRFPVDKTLPNKRGLWWDAKQIREYAKSL